MPWFPPSLVQQSKGLKKFPRRPSNELREELRKVALLEQEHGTEEGNKKEEDRKKPAMWFCAM
jgi:hypothetical protein